MTSHNGDPVSANAFAFTSSVPGTQYYRLGLLSVNPTNSFQTIPQPTALPRSLKTVSANPAKELQNVLPNCNPLPHHLSYHNHHRTCLCSLHPEGEGLAMRVLRTLTTINICHIWYADFAACAAYAAYCADNRSANTDTSDMADITMILFGAKSQLLKAKSLHGTANAAANAAIKKFSALYWTGD